VGNYSIVYIDDVLIFSKSIEKHWKHLNSFLEVIKVNGLVVSATKIKLFQTNIRFLGYNIHQSKISPISRVIQFAENSLIKSLRKPSSNGSLDLLTMLLISIKIFVRNVSHYLIDFKKIPLHGHTYVVKEVNLHVQTLPCLGIPTIESFKIVETDASDIEYGGILKQQVHSNQPEQIVRFHSGVWNSAQRNYSTIKKEILSIVLYISKFQDDLLNQKFLIRVDCISAKHILEKDVQNIASKQIFARW
jgi:hypothetical protein